MRFIFVLAFGCLLGLAHPAHAGDRAMLNAVNKIRLAHGLAPLRLHPSLEKAAKEQAVVMAKTQRMKHTAARGYDFKSRLARVRWNSLAAENIARGQKSFGRALQGWMNSRGHRRNMLHPRMRYLGLAVAKGGGRNYWAMILGG